MIDLTPYLTNTNLILVVVLILVLCIYNLIKDIAFWRLYFRINNEFNKEELIGQQNISQQTAVRGYN